MLQIHEECLDGCSQTLRSSAVPNAMSDVKHCIQQKIGSCTCLGSVFDVVISDVAIVTDSPRSALWQEEIRRVTAQLCEHDTSSCLSHKMPSLILILGWTKEKVLKSPDGGLLMNNMHQKLTLHHFFFS